MVTLATLMYEIALTRIVALGSLLAVVIALGLLSPYVLRATEHMTTPIGIVSVPAS